MRLAKIIDELNQFDFHWRINLLTIGLIDGCGRVCLLVCSKFKLG